MRNKAYQNQKTLLLVRTLPVLFREEAAWVSPSGKAVMVYVGLYLLMTLIWLT